jgi:hypothetical protein
MTGAPAESATGSIAGSTACAQQPHVTQVGGQAASDPGRSSPVQGSPTARADTPDVLSVNTATMTARPKWRTV